MKATSAAVLFSPHADDEVLFASHILIRHQPRVVICYGSERDYGATAIRTEESSRAVTLLGAGPVEQWDGGDLVAQMRALDAALSPARVFAPGLPASHPHHVAVADAAAEVFGARLTRYHTYVDGVKVRLGQLAAFAGEDARLKREALACYETQRSHPRACVFYDETAFDLDEYVAPAVDESEPGPVPGAEGASAPANDLLQRGVMSPDQARALDGNGAADESGDETLSVLPSAITAQPVPPLTTRVDKGPKKGKGGKGRG